MSDVWNRHGPPLPDTAIPLSSSGAVAETFAEEPARDHGISARSTRVSRASRELKGGETI